MLSTQPITKIPSNSQPVHFDPFLALQYVLAAGIFYIYGIQVCPFLESLDQGFLTRVIAILFVLLYFFRSYLTQKFIQKNTSSTIHTQFLIDCGVFIAGGLILAIGNSIVFDFPIDASVRVMIGFSFLGYFVSLQLMLKAENNLLSQGNAISYDNNQKIIPIARHIRTIAFSILLGSVISLLLVVWKDLEWLNTIGDDVSLEQAATWILYEFFFVGGVFFAYSFAIILFLSKNITLSFQLQLDALNDIKSGEREINLPVISNNEFRYLAEDTHHMLHCLKLSEENLNQTRDACIYAISSLAETRDNETGAHIIRTQEYIKAICLYLKDKPKFSAILSDEVINLIYKSAPLHDIGKVGIPDSILLKPGKLTDEEFAIMKEHPLIGKLAIEKAEERSGYMPFLDYAKEISVSHHEKWDGSGYPYGLKGDAIPLSGRLMALADVYDALITKRVYKPAFSHEKSKAIILEGKGKHFDPDIVDAFTAIEGEFIQIARAHKDQ